MATHRREYEAKYLMLRHAFETWGCLRVELKTDGLNQKSRNAILRIGAKEEGTLRRHLVTWTGRVRDTVYFSILDHEWPEVKPRLKQDSRTLSMCSRKVTASRCAKRIECRVTLRIEFRRRPSDCRLYCQKQIRTSFSAEEMDGIAAGSPRLPRIFAYRSAVLSCSAQLRNYTLSRASFRQPDPTCLDDGHRQALLQR